MSSDLAPPAATRFAPPPSSRTSRPMKRRILSNRRHSLLARRGALQVRAAADKRRHLLRPRAYAGHDRHRPPRPRLQQAERRSEEHTSELQSLMRNSSAVFDFKKKKQTTRHN